MGNTLKRVLATAPLAVALAVVGVTGTAHAATKASAESSAAESAAAITGVCSIYLYGLYFDGASFVTEGLCRAFANLYAGQYPPGAITYSWYPQA